VWDTVHAPVLPNNNNNKLDHVQKSCGMNLDLTHIENCYLWKGKMTVIYFWNIQKNELKTPLD
jgi:hypothetical protein